MSTIPATRDACIALDADDRLAPLRDLFGLPPGIIYLDGNSLGAMPRTASERVARVINDEWGRELIRAWNTAGWFDYPRRLGARIAPLIGADAPDVVVTDTTSINLYKVLSAAMHLVEGRGDASRRQVISERGNFPTDLYIADSLCRERGFELVLLDAERLPDALRGEGGTGAHGTSVAVLMLTHVDYRTGAMHDMAAMSAAARAAGALSIWDLAHSAGAVPLDLRGSGADFAIGCGYKYLNGGPGAPAFVWAHPRHADRLEQPLAGWWGHAAPFAFTPDFSPAPGIGRFLCGTQSMLGMAALECGLDTFAAADALGGIDALREKSLALTDLFIARVIERGRGLGLGVVTPLPHEARGSQVSLTLHADDPDAGFATMQALIARGVIGDFRAGDGAGRPDLLRFGFAPLYNTRVDAWDAVEHLRDILHEGHWRDPVHRRRAAVT